MRDDKKTLNTTTPRRNSQFAQEATAFFVQRFIPKKELQPFLASGELNQAQMEKRMLGARSVCVGQDFIQTRGFACLSLGPYFDKKIQQEASVVSQNNIFDNKNPASLPDDAMIRRAVDSFWKSPQGCRILEQRFGVNNNPHNDTNQTQLRVLATHITRRTAPPNHISLAHVDYPVDYNLKNLWHEWSNRWEPLLLNKNNEDSNAFVNSHRLCGVLTVWILLSPRYKDTKYPLWIADASTVGKDDSVVYRVGRRSSVGVHYSPHTTWYHAPDMQPYDAWIFDTQCNPHVAVTTTACLEDEKDYGDASPCRKSAEVRCLVVQKLSLNENHKCLKQF